MVAETAVFGLGNPLMGDEGVGIRVLEALERDPSLPSSVELIDLGTGGLRLLHEIAGRRRAVIIDCAFMGETPGSWRRFRPDQARSRDVRLRQSLHEGDLFSNLQLAQELGDCPDDIVIFGIEPASVEPGLALTAALEASLEQYVAAVRNECAAIT